MKTNTKTLLGVVQDSDALKPIGEGGDINQYDTAIIGITNNGNLVYSVDKMIEIFSKVNEVSIEESTEFLEYNCFSAYVGNMTPIYVYQYI